jgi:hypothetical protein
MRLAFFKSWMQDWEINLVKDVLVKLKPKKCLEWGTGYSTIYFTKFLPKNTQWISIEHEKSWATKIKFLSFPQRLFMNHSKIEVFHIPSNKFPWSDEHGDGTYSDLKDYVDFPEKFAPFDFILIDGRARKDCLLKSYKLLKKNGIVILHDAHRTYYHQPFALYKYQLLLNDHHQDAGGLWLGSKGINVKSLLSH